MFSFLLWFEREELQQTHQLAHWGPVAVLFGMTGEPSEEDPGWMKCMIQEGLWGVIALPTSWLCSGKAMWVSDHSCKTYVIPLYLQTLAHSQGKPSTTSWALAFPPSSLKVSFLLWPAHNAPPLNSPKPPALLSQKPLVIASGDGCVREGPFKDLLLKQGILFFAWSTEFSYRYWSNALAKWTFQVATHNIVITLYWSTEFRTLWDKQLYHQSNLNRSI